jgi:hypothetical protein
MRVVLSGASGLIGTSLRQHLSAEGHDVVQLVRRPAATEAEIQWAPERREIPATALDSADVVINLSGAGIGDKRWSRDRKTELIDTRVQPTATLAEAIAAATSKPVFLSASGIGFYGNRGDELLDETSTSGDLFLSEICRQWEDAAQPARDAGARVAHLRTGVVLTPKGGALARQLPLFKLGLGGKFGSGKQWLPWVTLDDEVRAIDFLMTAEVSGPVNICAPSAVTAGDFAKALGKALGRPAALPVPSFGPSLIFGSELVRELLLAGQHAVPDVLRTAGFTFNHAQLDVGLKELLKKPTVT